jgi:hypothetical protein
LQGRSSIRVRAARIALAAALVIVGAALAAPSASANYHLMKIREVYPGTALAPDRAFVELQMPAAGQNQVSGHEIVVYNSVGAVTATVPMTGNVPNGQSQRTILLGDIDVTNRDFPANIGTLVAPSGGAVCFPDASPPDCVAWGSFTGAASLPGAVGTPEPGAIPDGSSITRSITRGCPTALDAADDTDNSSADLALTTPTPRNNAATPTETVCQPPETTITRAPNRRVRTKKRRKRAKFRFTSSQPGSTFECSVDGDPFEACQSPFRTRVRKGRHTFNVRAIHPTFGTDPTPDEHNWKVKRKK